MPTILQPATAIQQWPTVDASYYGGRGAGGMHPLKVNSSLIFQWDEWFEKKQIEGSFFRI